MLNSYMPEYMLADQDHLIVDEQEVLSCQNLAVTYSLSQPPDTLPGEAIWKTDGLLVQLPCRRPRPLLPGSRPCFMMAGG